MADPVDILAVAIGLQIASWWRLQGVRNTPSEYVLSRLDHTLADIDVIRAEEFAKELLDAQEQEG